jgi:hypothetical protein
MKRASTSTSTKLRANLIANLLETLESCPIGSCNPPDCPLFALRKLKKSERLRWLNALTDADLEYFAAYHEVCRGVLLARHAGPGHAAPRHDPIAA